MPGPNGERILVDSVFEFEDIDDDDAIELIIRYKNCKMKKDIFDEVKKGEFFAEIVVRFEEGVMLLIRDHHDVDPSFQFNFVTAFWR